MRIRLLLLSNVSLRARQQLATRPSAESLTLPLWFRISTWPQLWSYAVRSEYVCDTNIWASALRPCPALPYTITDGGSRRLNLPCLLPTVLLAASQLAALELTT